MHGHQPRASASARISSPIRTTSRGSSTPIAPQPGDNLVEIGPGLAALTRPLIERAGHLTAIEIDRDLAARLAAEFPPGAADAARRRRARIRLRDARAGAARRRQPAVQHQLAAALPSRAVRRAARRPARDAAEGSGRADDGAPGNAGLRPAHRDAAGEVPRDAALRRAARRVPAGAQGRFGRRAPRSARRREAARSPTPRCSRASSPRRSASGARRCATRCRRCATRRRSKPPASIPARAARRWRSPISCASPMRWPGPDRPGRGDRRPR